ncbi:MAG: hypothetical protein Q9187_008393 [Circinaria calcarea]
MSSQTPEPPTNNMGLLISTHTLGPSIIARHNTPAAILDASELSLLRSFCLDPSRKDTILREHDVVDDQGQLREHDMVDTQGQGVGIKAQRGVSLAGYVIGRHGTERPALSEEEVGMLREWFESGGRATEAGCES